MYCLSFSVYFLSVFCILNLNCLSAGSLNIGLYLVQCRHDAEGALFRGHEGSGGIGKGQKLMELFLIKAVETVLENMVEGACAEGISGTGGLAG